MIREQINKKQITRILGRHEETKHSLAIQARYVPGMIDPPRELPIRHQKKVAFGLQSAGSRIGNNPRSRSRTEKPSNHRESLEEKKRKTYICGDGGAVEIGVSVRANPTPFLDTCDPLWTSECSSFPSARPTRVFGGIRLASFPFPSLLEPA